MYLEKISRDSEVKKQKLFRFEAMWAKENECESVIRDCWSVNSEQGVDARVFDNLQSLHVGLANWDLTSFGHVRSSVRKLRDELHSLQNGSRTQQSVEEMKHVRTKLEGLLDKEEMLWRQRGKAQCILEGDKNTTFFHSKHLLDRSVMR